MSTIVNLSIPQGWTKISQPQGEAGGTSDSFTKLRFAAGRIALVLRKKMPDTSWWMDVGGEFAKTNYGFENLNDFCSTRCWEPKHWKWANKLSKWRTVKLVSERDAASQHCMRIFLPLRGRLTGVLSTVKRSTAVLTLGLRSIMPAAKHLSKLSCRGWTQQESTVQSTSCHILQSHYGFWHSTIFISYVYTPAPITNLFSSRLLPTVALSFLAHWSVASHFTCLPASREQLLANSPKPWRQMKGTWTLPKME